jgi:transposase
MKPVTKFRARIVLEAPRGDATLTELALRHGAHANQIALWRKQLLEHAGEVFDHGAPESMAPSTSSEPLHTKTGELTMERDFFRCARPLQPADYNPPLDRESAVTTMRQCELLDLCARASITNRCRSPRRANHNESERIPK